MFLCVVVILSSSHGFSRRAALDEIAVQSAHSGFAPRVGGLCVYISLLNLIPLISFGFIPLAVVFELNTNELTLLIISAAPIFSIGLAEDLGYNMSPKVRLGASAISSLLSICLLQVWVSNIGFSVLDSVLLLAPVAILFTIFATVV